MTAPQPDLADRIRAELHNQSSGYHVVWSNAIRATVALHEVERVSPGGFSYCGECGTAYPCNTTRNIATALGIEP